MAATTAKRGARTSPPLAELPAEDWGAKMRRARERYARMNQDEAVAAVGRIMPVERSIVSRIEAEVDVPRSRRRRMISYLLAVTYGLDPGQFGLDPDDVPPGVGQLLRDGFFGPSDQAVASSKCTVLQLVAA